MYKVNEEEKQFYENKYIVGIWSGAGYELEQFEVYANCEEEALEIVVAYAEENVKCILFGVADVTEEEESRYVYVDGTMNGATQPYYILAENLRIEKV